MLQDKVALISGASRGIGRATVLRLASEGAKVVINYSRSDVAAAELVQTITANGGHAIAIKADVFDEAAVNSMFAQTAELFGTVDILVNNAGITRDRSTKKMTVTEFDEVLNTNLKGTFNCSKAAADGMIAKGYGKIINFSSVVAYTGAFGQANYLASKAGIDGLTRAFAAEWGSKGIRVNSIAPGFIQTDMTDGLSEERKEFSRERSFLKYLGTVDDIAGVVSFLAGRDSDFMTGQVLHVNGGRYLG